MDRDEKPLAEPVANPAAPQLEEGEEPEPGEVKEDEPAVQEHMSASNSRDTRVSAKLVKPPLPPLPPRPIAVELRNGIPRSAQRLPAAATAPNRRAAPTSQTNSPVRRIPLSADRSPVVATLVTPLVAAPPAASQSPSPAVYNTMQEPGSRMPPPEPEVDERGTAQRTLAEAETKGVDVEPEEGELHEPEHKVVDIHEFTSGFQAYDRNSRSQSPVTPDRIFGSPPPPAPHPQDAPTATQNDDGGEVEDGDVDELSPPSRGPNLEEVFRSYVGTFDIEEFQNNERIGQGTFGEVTIATHIATDRKVALKRIIVHKEKEGVRDIWYEQRTWIASSKSLLQLPITSIREIQILKAMRHRNVIAFEGMAFGKPNSKNAEDDQYEPGTLYMVFPYMSHDLFGLLKNPQITLQPAQIKSYAKQLLEGLSYLHGNDLLHRDLKSANILIDGDGTLKIADFGLARRYVATEAGASLTPTVVTLWYRPPEILLEEKTYDKTVDMWGYGCIFAEMWERTPVFQSGTESQALEKILSVCGTPKVEEWPEWETLLQRQKIEVKPKPRRIREIYRDRLDYYTITFIDTLLCLNPAKRLSAEEALRHDYFNVEPAPAEPGTIDFPGWPESHEMGIQDHLNEQAARVKELVKKQPGTTREQYEIRPAAHLDIVMQDGVPVKRRHLPTNGHHHNHQHHHHSHHQHNQHHQHSSSNSQQYQRKRRRETDDWADSGGARTRPPPGAPPATVLSSSLPAGGSGSRDEYPLPPLPRPSRDHHRNGDSWRASDDPLPPPPPRRSAGDGRGGGGGTESDRDRGRERDWDRAQQDNYAPRDRGARRRSSSRDWKDDDRGGRGGGRDGRGGGDAPGRRRAPPTSTRQTIVYD
ncbi:serine/threonine protein kinase, CMGC, CDC2/CDK sub [Geranomyces michiganensis]|nr:serine/threonine protein kinase, CMGC, CDC2/CDK sub [Geranomyces michiganensis]